MGSRIADTASCNVHALNGGQAVLYVALERALELRVALVAKLDSKADNGGFADVHGVAELERGHVRRLFVVVENILAMSF